MRLPGRYGRRPCGSDVRSTRKRKDRKSTRLNSSHSQISYAVFCLKKKKSTVDLVTLRPTSHRRLTLHGFRTPVCHKLDELDFIACYHHTPRLRVHHVSDDVNVPAI